MSRWLIKLAYFGHVCDLSTLVIHMLRAGVQVGRAGRDGGPASCHLFLDDADFLRLRSLAHTDGIDATTVASFLRAVFESEVQLH